MIDSSAQSEQVALDALEEQLKNVKHRPLKDWSPEHQGEIAIRIKRDGSWLYQDSPINRQALVKLFASVLLCENDNHYLITPVEKLRIEVDDAPFVATTMQVFHASTAEQVIAFTSNIDEQVIVDSEHRLWVEYDAEEQPAPYVHIRDGLNALLSRSVWLELAQYIEEHSEKLVVRSSGTIFALQS